MDFSASPMNYTARDAKNAGNTAMHNAIDWVYGKIVERIQEQSLKSDQLTIDFTMLMKAYEEPCPIQKVLNKILDSLRDAGFSASVGSSSLGGSDVIHISWSDEDTEAEQAAMNDTLKSIFGK